MAYWKAQRQFNDAPRELQSLVYRLNRVRPGRSAAVQRIFEAMTVEAYRLAYDAKLTEA